jgi:CheY-like chemotaxis protein
VVVAVDEEDDLSYYINIVFRKIVKRMLESNANKSILGEECTILEADDGSTALDLMRSSETEVGRAVDFVLMDYVMIRMNGPEAVQRMRSDLGYKGVVIGITGNALPEDMDNFRSHGADLVLTKPLTNARLMEAMTMTRDDGSNQIMDMV